MFCSPTVARPLHCLHSAASSSCAAHSPSAASVPDTLQPALLACPCSRAMQHLGVSLLSVEWSCSPTFSPLLGEAVIDKLKNLHFTIRGLVSVSSWGTLRRFRLSGGKSTARKSHWSWYSPRGPSLEGMGHHFKQEE